MKAEGLILDTCALIWLSQRAPIAQEAIDKIKATKDAPLLLRVSVMSAWEIGMLVSKGKLPVVRQPQRWFNEFAESGAITLEQVTSDILIASSFLPEPIHNDPMDRILIATAREHDLTIVTRDRAILAYGAVGHVKTLAC